MKLKLKLKITHAGKFVESIALIPPKEAIFGRKSGGVADKMYSDEMMSSRHFRVFPEGDGWSLRDLDSRNGTKVNRKLIKACVLGDGDEIQAGRHLFNVSLVAMHDSLDTPGLTGSPTTSSSTFDPDGIHEIAVLADRGELNIPISLEISESGQSYFRGEMVKVQSAAELLLALRQSKVLRHPWLVVDRGRLECPLPEVLDEKSIPIVDWVNPEYTNSVSPRLINLSEIQFPVWESLVADAWGQDSIIVLFTDHAEAELLQILRTAVRQGTAISGVLWPSVLSEMLLKSKGGPAAELLSACTAILMEFPDLAEAWLLAGAANLQRRLEKLGMICAVPLESSESPMDK